MTKLHCDLSDAVNMLLFQGAAVQTGAAAEAPAGSPARTIRCGEQAPNSDPRCAVLQGSGFRPLVQACW